jgi:hypothetical protein
VRTVNNVYLEEICLIGVKGSEKGESHENAKSFALFDTKGTIHLESVTINFMKR